MTAFEFEWTKSKSEKSGKALKRRKKPLAEPDAQPERKKGKSSQAGEGPSRRNATPVANVLIKRKQKKDKLANLSDVIGEKSKSSAQHALFSVPRKNVYVNTNLKGKSVVEKVFESDQKKFSDLGIHRHLVSNLEKNQFLTATNVQNKAIPEVMTGANVLVST